MGNRFLFKLTAFAVAMAMVVLGAGVALADTVEADVIEATSANETSRNLGTVLPNQALSPTVSFTMVCKGSNHPEAGQTVTLSRSSATLDGSAADSTVVGASTATVGAVPASWPDDVNGPDNCGTTAPLADNGNSTVTFNAPASPGSHSVVVTYAQALSPVQAGDSSDITGSAPSVTFTFTVAGPSDSTAPNTTITSAPSSPTNSASASFTFTSTENPSTFECQLDGGSWTACDTGSITYGPLASGDHTFLVAAKDAANNQDSSAASHTWTIDTTAPTGSASINSGDAFTRFTASTLTLTADSDTTHYQKAEGANCSSVTFGAWTAFTGSVSHTLASGDGTKQVCVQFRDAAQNISGANDSILLDTTAPSITDGGPTTQPNAADWYKTAVTNTFNATDSLSGLASGCSASFTKSSGTAEGSAVRIASGSCSDLAGNTNTGIDSAAVRIDRTDPTNFQFSGEPETHYYGQTPTTRPTCTAEDALSGLTSDGCTVSDYATAVGTHTLRASATDRAGNTGTAQSASYSVLGWKLTGFYSPVDMGSTTNSVKAGSTVPLKFEVFAGTTEFTDTAVVSTFKVQIMSCGSLNGTPIDEIEVYSTGGTALRYDSTGGQFIQNWKVPTGSNSCYKVVLTTDDGSTATAYFKTK